MSTRMRRHIAVLAIAAVGLTTASVTGAQAQPGAGVLADNGQITFTNGGNAFVANPDGTNERLLVSGTFSVPTWSPDGSRFVFENTAGKLVTRRADGSDEVLLSGEGETGTTPSWSPFGAVFYSSVGTIRYVGGDGGWWRGTLFPPDGSFNIEPTVNRFGEVVFTRVASPNMLYRYDLSTGTGPTQIVSNGQQPSFSPDGTKLVFMRADAGTGTRQLWLANRDGSNQQQLTQETGVGASQPAWSPDGSAILFLRAASLASINVASGVVTPLNRGAVDTAWQPVGTNGVGRVWGQDHVDTAVAASQFNYATAGNQEDVRVPAGAVVLSRDDTFLDALVGSAFAVKQSAPLLITNRGALDSRVEREVNRVLGGQGTVYLLGGTIALAPAVESRLVQLGYRVERIWGQTHFDTAIAINRRITSRPQYAIVTTGTNYYDALAAGAAAGASDNTVIVLTEHTQMPSSSAAYLNEMVPNGTNDPNQGTWIVSAGGPGDAALINGWDNGQLWPWKQDDLLYFRLVGNNEMDTALDIADFFFAAPSIAAVATNRAWFDALTGGAMIGFNNGPLLITDPNALYGPVRDYLSRNAGNMWDMVMLGGPAALPAGLQVPIGEAISLPGKWEYFDITPETAGPGVATQSQRETPTTKRTTTQVRPDPAGDRSGDLITVDR